MKIHGIRIYPQSLDVVPTDAGTIFVHGSVSDDCTDFFYIFRPLMHIWYGHFFAKDFSVSYNADGGLEDPLPVLRENFGSSLFATDIDSQLMLLKGDDFATWGATMHLYEGAFIPIFREAPTFELLKLLYWNSDFQLTSDTWPLQMRAVLHMWDDIYWQLFTTDYTDIETLIGAHSNDPKLKMYYVNFDLEYPDPSNQELQVVVPI